MERDRAIDIATKFAVQFPRIAADATRGRDGDWAVRLALPNGLEAWAYTPETARILWPNIALLEALK